MQLNCVLFPGRRTSNLTQIESNIVLIPRENQKSHLTYLKFLNPKDTSTDHLQRVVNQMKPSSLQPIEPYSQSLNNSTLQKPLPYYLQQKIRTKRGLQEHLEENKSYPLRDSAIKVEHAQETQQHPMTVTKVNNYIPSLFLPGKKKLIVYLHGNAEDLSSTWNFASFINKSLGFSVIVMEYPGYSVYEGACSADQIQRDCLQFLYYLEQIGFQLGDIFVIGRSIGTGPALFLCSYYKVAGLMLISPFLSISTLVRDKYGLIPSVLVQQRFQNYKVISFVSVPIFILHGLEDSLIPYSHSVQLQKYSKGMCLMKLVQKMTHTSFDFRNDFMEPLKSFLKRINF